MEGLSPEGWIDSVPSRLEHIHLYDGKDENGPEISFEDLLPLWCTRHGDYWYKDGSHYGSIKANSMGQWMTVVFNRPAECSNGCDFLAAVIPLSKKTDFDEREICPDLSDTDYSVCPHPRFSPEAVFAPIAILAILIVLTGFLLIALMKYRNQSVHQTEDEVVQKSSFSWKIIFLWLLLVGMVIGVQWLILSTFPNGDGIVYLVLGIVLIVLGCISFALLDVLRIRHHRNGTKNAGRSVQIILALQYSMVTIGLTLILLSVIKSASCCTRNSSTIIAILWVSLWAQPALTIAYLFYLYMSQLKEQSIPLMPVTFIPARLQGIILSAAVFRMWDYCRCADTSFQSTVSNFIVLMVIIPSLLLLPCIRMFGHSLIWTLSLLGIVPSLIWSISRPIDPFVVSKIQVSLCFICLSTTFCVLSSRPFMLSSIVCRPMNRLPSLRMSSIEAFILVVYTCTLPGILVIFSMYCPYTLHWLYVVLSFVIFFCIILIAASISYGYDGRPTLATLAVGFLIVLPFRLNYSSMLPLDNGIYISMSLLAFHLIILFGYVIILQRTISRRPRTNWRSILLILTISSLLSDAMSHLISWLGFSVDPLPLQTTQAFIQTIQSFPLLLFALIVDLTKYTPDTLWWFHPFDYIPTIPFVAIASAFTPSVVQVLLPIPGTRPFWAIVQTVWPLIILWMMCLVTLISVNSMRSYRNAHSKQQNVKMWISFGVLSILIILFLGRIDLATGWGPVGLIVSIVLSVALLVARILLGWKVARSTPVEPVMIE